MNKTHALRKLLMSAVFVLVLSSGSVPFPGILQEACAAATNYNLKIGGVQVTSDTRNGEGWSFDPDTNTLTLNNSNFAVEKLLCTLKIQ